MCQSGIMATLLLLDGISFAAKKVMGTSKFMNGLNGALGLYAGVKGMLDSADAASRQRKLLSDAKAEEEGWFRRNYYSDFLNNSSAKAAIKRVENTLRRQNQQNRAYSAINGTTHEHALARNRQGLNSLENVYTSLAAMADDKKNRIDSIHRQNRNALLSQEMNYALGDEKNSALLAKNGLNLLQNAVLGVNWGKETR